MDYRRFLNDIGMRRQSGSYLTGLLESVQDIPDMISLAGGLPNPSLFPILSGTFKLKDGEEVYLDESTMAEVQQYSSSQGYPPFRQWCERFIKSYHDPPCWENADESKTKIMVTSGAAEAYTKVLEMCVKEGDKVLVEIPTFSSAIDNLLTLGAEPLGVQGDAQGMIPGELRSVMSKWRPQDADDPHSDVPKLMYVIPSSNTPSGATLPLERKREIYEIAREYNLLIVEDDPYYFLQFGGRLEPSFLSIDTDGRVLRADSFSTCMTPGLRLGILSGPALLVSKVQSHVSFSQEHSNNLAQAVLHKIFEAWGEQGTKKRWREISAFYERQKNAMMSSAKRWLTGLAEFVEPQGGMFLWIRLTTIPDSRKLIEEKSLSHKIAMAPGCIFTPNRDDPSPYLRANYSTIPIGQIDVAMQRMAEMIKEKMASNPEAYRVSKF